MIQDRNNIVEKSMNDKASQKVTLEEFKEFDNYFVKKKVIVTGATGFIGSHLCNVLHNLGAEVSGIDLNTKSLWNSSKIKLFDIDLQDLNDTSLLINKIRPEIIFHLAGLVDTRQEKDAILPTLKNNLVVTVNILLALEGIEISRIILAGSSEIPGMNESPNSPYSASKLAMISYADMFNELFKLPIVVAKPHLIYGPGQASSKLIPYIINSYLQNQPPKLSSGKRICDMVYIKDVIRGLLFMSREPNAIGKKLDLGSGKGISIREIALLISTLMKCDIDPIFGSVPDRVGDFPQIANIELSREILGWEPKWTQVKGLEETIDWYKIKTR